MALKRYSREELIEKLDGIILTELATSNDHWEGENVTTREGVSIPRQASEIRLKNLNVFHQKIDDYNNKIKEPGLSDENRLILARARDIVKKLVEVEENLTLKTQEMYYKKDKNIFLSRGHLELPLDKKINALYDDLSAFYLMTEDVATLGNNKALIVEHYGDNEELYRGFAERNIKDSDKRKEFLSLQSLENRVRWAKEFFGPNAVEVFESIEDVEERKEFLKKHVLFTNRLMCLTNNPSIIVCVSGEVISQYAKFDSRQTVLPEEFCDFGKIGVSDTLKIKNNDILQWIQTKIDFDKENLKVVDEQTLRGDVYQLKKLPKGQANGGWVGVNNYLVRYVCPSTGRVYHNGINENTLSNSKYYKDDDVKSILPAWWHITHCGEDPYKETVAIRS